MKSMMKKTLVIVLALALALIAPMTAMAAGESEWDPVVLDGTATTHQVTVEAGATVYYSYQAEGYFGRNTYNITVSNSTRSYDYYVLTQNPMTGMFMQNMPNPIAVTAVSTMSGMMGSVVFAIQNVGETAIDFTVATEIDLPKPGSQDMPDTELTLGEATTVECLEKNYGSYYYQWTATEAGTFTVTLDESCLDVCDWSVCIQYVDKTDGSTDWTSAYNTKADGNEPTVSTTVEVGDVVNFYVSDFNLGYITFTATVTSDSDDNGDDNGDVGGDEGGEDIGGGEDELNYADYTSTYLEVGENMYVVDGSYQYTVYAFEPSEEGKYTFSSDDSVMGIVSNNGMWITTDPSAETVNANEFTWECNSVGQSIWVAVMANTNVANITITKEELAPVVEPEYTVYENKATPEAFEYDGDVAELELVNTEDDVIDNAVLGEDGYYHLNTADGPILYVDLNDKLISMVGLVGATGLNSYVVEDGVIVEKIDYTTAMMDYIACADVIEIPNEDVEGETTSMYLYPLTEDLMVMYKEGGAAKGWYDADLGLIGDVEDGWMFACYYVPAVEDGGNEGGNEGGNVADPEIPNTGAEAFGVAIAMMATVAALGATVVTTKKSKRVK